MGIGDLVPDVKHVAREHIEGRMVINNLGGRHRLGRWGQGTGGKGFKVDTWKVGRIESDKVNQTADELIIRLKGKGPM